MRVVGYTVGLGLFAYGMFLGGSLQRLFDFTSLLIVMGAALAFTGAAHGGDLWHALKAGFGNPAGNEGESAHMIQVLRSLRSTLLGAGIAATLLGWIQMLFSFETLTAKTFGPAAAVSLLTIFYAVLLSELLVVPAFHRLEKRVSNSTVT